MTAEEQPVRLVLRGGAAVAPVCDGDVCHLPAAGPEPIEDDASRASTRPAGAGTPRDPD